MVYFGAWATVQVPAFVTGSFAAIFFVQRQQKVFPLLSLPCSANNLFSAFIEAIIEVNVA